MSSRLEIYVKKEENKEMISVTAKTTRRTRTRTARRDGKEAKKEEIWREKGRKER
jgi:hypothetical protein